MLELSKKYLKTNKNSLIKDDIKKLQNLIKYHSDLYYNKDTPILSDSEYDELFKKLEYLEEKYNLENKQTSLIGAEIIESTFKKVKHSRPMISLDNTYNEQDLENFHDRVLKNLDYSNLEILPSSSKKEIEEDINKKRESIKYSLEFKFDGLGIELIYKNGELKQAITRGNGIEGEDVTANIMQIDNIPKKIDYKEHLEVRGEVVMPISAFDKLNENAKKYGTKVFSNPRNAASGSVRMKNSLITKERKLKFFAYDLANFNDFKNSSNHEKYSEIIYSIEKIGFEISSYFHIYNGITELIDAIKNFGDVKKQIDFEIDGLVLKVDNIDLWEQIGWTQHHPKYAIAYKFPAEIFTTKILSIEHSVGRTGTLTPVANLEGVNMGGAIIRRATLHNYEEVESLDVRIGDNVFIKRAGEVIPKIISVAVKKEPRSKKILAPEFCPSCNSQVLKDEGKVRFYCPNEIDCLAKNSEKLVFSVGKQGFNIDGFGEKQVKLFLKLGLITNLVDIFNIKEKEKEILKLEGFQKKSVENLISGVEKAKKIEIHILLTALGIAGVGKKTAKTIAALFKTKNDLLNLKYNLEEIEKLDDIGPEIAKNIYNYFTLESNIDILKKLTEILEIKYFEEKTIENQTIFTGKKVCITGSFISEDGIKIARDDLVKKLENVGGFFIGSVSKKTDFLLIGDKAGSKREKAEKLKIEIIDLDYFLKNLS